MLTRIGARFFYNMPITDQGTSLLPLLIKKNPNADKILTFTPVLKRGHIRLIILKGKENF